MGCWKAAHGFAQVAVPSRRLSLRRGRADHHVEIAPRLGFRPGARADDQGQPDIRARFRPGDKARLQCLVCVH
jgi:hypothetical protein